MTNQPMTNLQKGNKKLINAWATYDLANSVYNLVITATIFPIYYKAVTTTRDANGEEISNIVTFLGYQIKNTSLYDFAIAFAFLMIAAIAPLLSGIADYSGNKKRFMQFFCYLGASSCALMYFFNSETLYLGIILVILACIGFSGSLVFYNSYLPEIAEPADHDRVSAKGFAMGYIGSALLLIVNLIMVMTQETGAEKLRMMQWSFITVGIWWFVFSQITFYYLPDNSKEKKSANSEGNRLLKGYKELKKVWQELKNDGVATSLSSVKRTLSRRFLLKKRSPWKRFHPHQDRPTALQPGDLVQLDTIHRMIDDKKRLYVFTGIDVYSRGVLSHANTYEFTQSFINQFWFDMNE